MPTTIQVFPFQDHVQPRAASEAPAPRRTARHVLLFAWTFLVAVPWVLQFRSFSALAARHKITFSLVPAEDAVPVTNEADVLVRCPANGLLAAGVWYRIYPTHYFDSKNTSNGSVICHFVMPQYNAHGMYNIQNRKVKPVPSAPRSCADSGYAANHYFYHGSIGYFALYTEGEGSYCHQDTTIHEVTTGVGSSDINLNALARYDGAPGYHTSYVFGCVGTLWLAYRAVGLARSFLSCSRFGYRLDALNEGISLSNAVVYAQQAARLAPHASTNWHRLVLVYFLLEGLMTDLFLVIAFNGLGAKLQYISLGYNVAGFLSMLFEMAESSKLLKASNLLLVKRLLFNTEMALKGELLFSIAMSYYITAVNRSELGRSPQIAAAVSHYVWGLFNHAVIIVGQTAFILAVRVIGTLIYVRYRYGSLRILTMACCVDAVMGYRCKIVRMAGYELHNARLCFAKETLKAHGLFKIVDTKGNEYLVYHKIHWLPSNRDDLTILGKVTGEHVDPWPESLYAGPVATCDRVLGSATTDDWIPNDNHEGVDDLETAHLINGH